ncbi:phosphatase PAP2 family protein [Natrialbaceae archaeon GCM10025810]|uniref:phosphatase PAP2 family protein n=1 Tax=Halovalidus salilacus TaxID=3075124 RepID=UPI0036083670
MARGIGEFEPIRAIVGEWLALLAALLTQLGDVWFVVVLVSALYVSGTSRVRWREAEALPGLVVIGFGVVGGLKALFALPRPPEVVVEPELVPAIVRPLYAATAAADGYGFPSGHAVIVTVVYVWLAHVLTVSTRRRRFAAAAAIVAVVCSTRVLLGVHYVVDVVAGVVVGLVLLVATRVVVDRAPTDPATVTFGLGVAAAAFYYVASGGDTDSVLLLGAALGAFGGWHVGRLRTLERRRRAFGASQRGRSDDERGGRVPAAGSTRRLRIAGAVLGLLPVIGFVFAFSVAPIYAAGGAIGLVAAAIAVVPNLRDPRGRALGANSD